MADLNQILKSKLEQAEVPYNPAHWTEMEQKLNAQASGMSNKVKGFIGAAAVVAGVTLGGIFMDSDSVQTENPVTTETVMEVQGEVESNQHVVSDETNQGKTAKEATANDANEPRLTSENNALVDEEVLTNEVISTEQQDADGNNNNTKSGSAGSSWGKFSVSATEICEGKTIMFSIEGITTPVSYLWNFGDGNTSNLPAPTHEYKNDGVYDVSLTLTDLMSGADSSQTKENLITVLAAPEVTLDWELSNVLDIDAQVYFNAEGLSADETVVWNLGDGNVSSESSLTHTYNTVGTKAVSLIATKGTTGCTTKLEEDVKVINDYNLLAPTGFNPKSLIDKNKVFIPVGLKTLKADYTFEFEVFNPRKGMERVYNTNQYVGWNGKFENVGESLPAGIYSWQAIVKRPDGSEKKFVGSVTLLQ